ncbi:hypothetical protein QYF36_022598 [Acer negundo]|nr:hypothetical protein QYF36_022598 [Acer negundo]
MARERRHSMKPCIEVAPSLLEFSLKASELTLRIYRFKDYGGSDCCRGSNLRVAGFYHSSHYVLPIYTTGLIWFDSIKKLLELAYEVEELSISISIWDTVDSFTMDKFQNRSPSLPCEVGNLTIDAGDVQPSSYAALLDCLLWICYPKILSIKAYHSPSSIKFIMWLYEKMMTRDAKCCNGHEIKCWRYYLKDIKIIPSKDSKPKLQPGSIRFRLDWCFSEHIV